MSDYRPLGDRPKKQERNAARVDGGRLQQIDGLLDLAALYQRGIPLRQWLVADLIPMGNVTQLSGDGGLGKSLLALQLAVCAALLLAFGLQTLSVVLPAMSGSLAAAMAGAVGYGATFIGIVSLTLAFVGRRSPHNPGKAMARLTLSYGVAQMLAPVVAGYMAQATGSFRGALWLTAAVMAAGMALLATLPDEH